MQVDVSDLNAFFNIEGDQFIEMEESDFGADASLGWAGWNKGMTMDFSPERGKKIGASLKNYVKTEEHRKNISETMKGRTPWNKGKSRFANEEERLAHKREYARLRSQRIRDEKKGIKVTHP